jgi:hypothetical protein
MMATWPETYSEIEKLFKKEETFWKSFKYFYLVLRFWRMPVKLVYFRVGINFYNNFKQNSDYSAKEGTS